MTDKEYIKFMEEQLRLETERANRNYEVAIHFEGLYDTLIDWVMEQEDLNDVE